jgi:hypothetical protein
MLKAGGKRSGFVRDRHGNPVEQTTASIEQLIESGTRFAGTPDDVYDQIKALSDSVGGFGHLLFGQGGFLDHKDTVANITLFAKEVMPRLAALIGRRLAAARFGIDRDDVNTALPARSREKPGTRANISRARAQRAPRSARRISSSGAMHEL